MATEKKVEGNDQSSAGDQVIGLTGKIQAKCRELKEHAEAYPYVWGSYAVVYGGFGLWFAYRWRRLRKTEDRVRVLQERLRKIAQADEAVSSSSTSCGTHVDKPPK